jgi:hypothetical protein
VRQNQESTSVDGGLAERGKETLVGWRPEHTFAVQENKPTEEVSP